MKNITFIIVSFTLIISCSFNNESKKINNQSTQLVHSKFSNINNNLSYNEYKSLIIDYGKNGKFPDISK